MRWGYLICGWFTPLEILGLGFSRNLSVVAYGLLATILCVGCSDLIVLFVPNDVGRFYMVLQLDGCSDLRVLLND